ncbi:MAG: (2Fe-2S)-binding protein [Nitrososphaeria archaeon]|jgi:carbon-monoxide dehydrogenase small subunit
MRVKFELNGSAVELDVEPWESLFDVLREKLGIRSVKTALCEGSCSACGACTVLMDGRPIYSVMTPAYRADGRSITTLEGLSRGGELHPLQSAFVEAGAVQCGFCTSGMILMAKAFLDGGGGPDEREIREAIRGNLCRCTGYVKIIDAIRVAAERSGGGVQ